LCEEDEETHKITLSVRLETNLSLSEHKGSGVKRPNVRFCAQRQGFERLLI